MRRIRAAEIDGFVCMVILIVVIEILLLSEMAVTSDISTAHALLVFFTYLFICDYCFKGKTMGKRIMGVEVHFMQENPNYMKFAFVHAGCCACLYMIFFIGLLLLYLGNGRMMYENWLNIRID